MDGVFINTMKTTFQITSLQVNIGKLLIAYMYPYCLNSLVEIKIEVFFIVLMYTTMLVLIYEKEE